MKNQQVMSGQVMSGQVMSGQVMSGHVSPISDCSSTDDSPRRRWREIGSDLREKVGTLLGKVKLMEKPVEYIQRLERRRGSGNPSSSSSSSSSPSSLHPVWELGQLGALLNLGPDLVMRGLEHGVFTAEVSLTRLPNAGEVSISTRANTLYLISTDATPGLEVKTFARGYVTLPIFLDLDTLKCNVLTIPSPRNNGADFKFLQISAFMKGVLATTRASAPAILASVGPVQEYVTDGGRRLTRREYTTERRGSKAASRQEHTISRYQRGSSYPGGSISIDLPKLRVLDLEGTARSMRSNST